MTHASASAMLDTLSLRNGEGRGPRSIYGGPSLTRRSLLGGLGAAALLPRHALAAGAGVPFGGAIQSDYFDDPLYRQAFLDRCDLIMPMNELKFGLVHPERDRYNFGPADMIVDWALAHGRTSRGHAFLWYNSNPAWLEAITDPAEAERVLIEHIERVGDHFRGRLTSWDVVNEVIAHDPTGWWGEELRDTFWLQRLGPDHVPIAFRAAARADPTAKLVINDYDLEFAGPRSDARRRIMLDLVRRLQDQNLRVDAVGCQAHLYAHFAIDVEAVVRFREDLARLGVDFIVTELDVIDFQIPGGPAEQDAAAAKVVGDLMDAVLDGRAPLPLAVVAWGITDRYSWVDGAMPRDDGQPSRPLPLDAQFQPKAWYTEMRARLAAA